MVDLWIWKIRIWGRWIDFKNLIRRNIYCRFGYHNVTATHSTTYNHYKEKLELYYLDCCVCGKLFFRNQEEKKLYRRIEESRNAQIGNMLMKIMKNGK